MQGEAEEAAVRTISASINYLGPGGGRPRYHASNHAENRFERESRMMTVSDVRSWPEPPHLDRQGFILLPHQSSIRDFGDRDAIARVHTREIEELVRDATGADRVIFPPTSGLRFSERSSRSGKSFNSIPARLAHVDYSDATGTRRAAQLASGTARKVRRFAHFNVWRALSKPPQDTPLGLCDARSVRPQDLVAADFIYDSPGQQPWSFEGLLVLHNPDHSWAYYSNMTADEALIFKTHDSDSTRASHVPHSAFDDSTCPQDAEPRTSLEMRGVAYWFE